MSRLSAEKETGSPVPFCALNTHSRIIANKERRLFEMLSVIIPAYNEEAMIPRTVAVIGGILQDAEIPYELIIVDDGSKDKTWELIVLAAASAPFLRGVHFSRNFLFILVVLWGGSGVKRI